MALANFLLSEELPRNDDSEDAVAEDDAHNYKGVFFGNHTEQQFYQAGAHFDYKDICRRLNLLISSGQREEGSLVGENGSNVGIIRTLEINLKDNASRNKKLATKSNTIKVANVVSNTISLKPLKPNNPFAKQTITSNNIKNGADQMFNQGMTYYKNENLFAKQVEYYSKIVDSSRQAIETNEHSKKSKEVAKDLKALPNNKKVVFIKLGQAKPNGMNITTNDSTIQKTPKTLLTNYTNNQITAESKNTVIQPKKSSYLRLNRTNTMRKTFSNESRADGQCNTQSDKESDQLKMSKICSNSNDQIRQKIKQSECSQKKFTPLKYKDIHLKSQSKELKEHNIINGSHAKSRNVNNKEIFSKTAENNCKSSSSVTLTITKKQSKNIFTKTIMPMYPLTKFTKNGLNISDKSISEKRNIEMKNTNLVLKNYLNTKQISSTKAVNSKKPVFVIKLKKEMRGSEIIKQPLKAKNSSSREIPKSLITIPSNSYLQKYKGNVSK